MEKKTVDALRVMLCGEIEEIAKQGKLSHESLDILKDLVETEMYLTKIEKYAEEKKEKEEMKKMGGMSMPMNMGMDGGYSQRKYYIDADYQPGQSMARSGSYDMGNSYARGGNSRAGGSYAYDMYARAGGGNSNGMPYDPMYEMPMYARAGGQGSSQSRAMGGYARTSNREEMIEEMNELLKEATDEKVRSAISEAINKLQK